MVADYRGLIQRQVQKLANNYAGNLPESIIFRVASDTPYDPVTDTGGVTYGSIAVDKAFVLTYRQFEIDDNKIRSTDRKVLIAALDMPTVEEVKTSDKMTIDGDDWLVVNARLDPARAIHVVQVRKP